MQGQELFNIAIAIAGALGGFVLKTFWDAINDLRRANALLAEKVSDIEVTVAGKYVTRDELARLVDAMFSKLDKIESKIDRKADKT